MADYLTTAGAGAGAGSAEVKKLPPGLEISDFDLGKTVGTGSFGRVCVATHRDTNTFWAIKQLAKSAVLETQQVSSSSVEQTLRRFFAGLASQRMRLVKHFFAQVEHILSERNILLQIDHPFIVNMAATFQGDLLHVF